MAAVYTNVGDFILKQLLGFATMNKIKANTTYLKENLIDAGWPAGVKTLFYQNTAPAGWVIDAAPDGFMVYATKGSVAGGRTGGTTTAADNTTITGSLATKQVVSSVNPTFGNPLAVDSGDLDKLKSVTTAGGVSTITLKGADFTTSPNADYHPKSANCLICTKSAYP